MTRYDQVGMAYCRVLCLIYNVYYLIQVNEIKLFTCQITSGKSERTTVMHLIFHLSLIRRNAVNLIN